MAENKQDRPEDTTSQAMVLMGRLLALEGEIAGLKSGAGFVSGDVCAQLAGWIPGGGGGEGIDYSTFAFGLVAFGNYVRVYKPAIQHNEFFYCYPPGTYTDVLITSGTSDAPSYIVCKYIRKSSITVQATTYATVPTPSIDYFWIPIASVYLDASGNAVIKCRLVTGMIFFSGEI